MEANTLRYWCYSCSSEQTGEDQMAACPTCASEFLELLPDRPPEPAEQPPINIVPAEVIFGQNSIFQRLHEAIEH
jgi:hypothetical protein